MLLDIDGDVPAEVKKRNCDSLEDKGRSRAVGVN
jgi:hypothetical protein